MAMHCVPQKQWELAVDFAGKRPKTNRIGRRLPIHGVQSGVIAVETCILCDSQAGNPQVFQVGALTSQTGQIHIRGVRLYVRGGRPCLTISYCWTVGLAFRRQPTAL